MAEQEAPGKHLSCLGSNRRRRYIEHRTSIQMQRIRRTPPVDMLLQGKCSRHTRHPDPGSKKSSLHRQFAYSRVTDKPPAILMTFHMPGVRTIAAVLEAFTKIIAPAPSRIREATTSVSGTAIAKAKHRTRDAGEQGEDGHEKSALVCSHWGEGITRTGRTRAGERWY